MSASSLITASFLIGTATEPAVALAVVVAVVAVAVPAEGSVAAVADVLAPVPGSTGATTSAISVRTRGAPALLKSTDLPVDTPPFCATGEGALGVAVGFAAVVPAVGASAAFAGSSAIAGLNAIAASTNAATHAPLRQIVPVELDLTLFNSVASRASLLALGTTPRLLKSDP